MLRFAVAAFVLSAFALPAFSKTHKDTYPNACGEVWAAVKDTVGNTENYTVKMTDEARMTASYTVKHSAHVTLTGALRQRPNTVSLSSKGTGCEMSVESNYSGFEHNDAGDFTKRVNESLAKERVDSLRARQTGGRKMTDMQRRDFLKRSTGASVAALTAASAGRIAGANDRLNVGLIGCGGRGTFDARLMRGTPEDIQAVAPANYHDGNLDPRLKSPSNVDIAALCDVYGSRVQAAKRWAPQAKTYDDFRKLLADKSIDAVIIATQDQWHAQMLILACEAGKDVYLEKPVMYRLGEARAMIDAVRRTKRIVQIGTQHRSADHYAEAAKIVQGGKLGEVRFVRIWNYMSRSGGGPAGPDGDPPADLNWDAWLGPAPKVPYNRSRLDLPQLYGLHQRDH